MLSVTVLTSGAAPTVLVSGEIDMATAPDLWTGVEQALAGGSDRLVFDFTGVSYIDSFGLRALAQVSARTSVRVVGVRPHVRRVFEVVAMDHLLPPLAPPPEPGTPPPATGTGAAG